MVNLEKLNHWLMLAANIGVIAGIVFLGFEIRQNSEAMLAGSRQDLLEADVTVLENLMAYPQLYNPAGHDAMEGLEKERLHSYFVMIMRIREYAWNQYNNGVLDEPTLQSYLAPLEFIFNSDTGREWFRSREFRGDPDFQEYVINYLGVEQP